MPKVVSNVTPCLRRIKVSATFERRNEKTLHERMRITKAREADYDKSLDTTWLPTVSQRAYSCTMTDIPAITRRATTNAAQNKMYRHRLGDADLSNCDRKAKRGPRLWEWKFSSSTSCITGLLEATPTGGGTEEVFAGCSFVGSEIISEGEQQNYYHSLALRRTLIKAQYQSC